jgi:hypothetical protein
MIDKHKLTIWLKTTEEEILRLQNCKDYINVIYYKNDEISYSLHEDLIDIFVRQINKNKTVVEFINIMLDYLDNKRLDTLLEFRDFVNNPISGMTMEIASKIRMILMTPSTELNEEN